MLFRSFKGFKNPKEYYERASLLLLTSDFEGFPLVVVEAMSFGVVPIIYGSYPAAYDIIENGINGAIAPSKNGVYDEKEMLKCILAILEDNNRREKMANSAMLTSKNYCVDNIYEEWNKIFS